MTIPVRRPGPPVPNGRPPSSATPPPGPPKRRLGELLLSAGLLTQAQLDAALTEQQRWGGKLGHIVVDLGFVEEKTMVRALSQHLGLASVDLDTMSLAPDVVRHLRVDLADRYGVFPLGGDEEQGTVDLAMSDPTNAEVIKELEVRTGKRFRISVATSSGIDRAIRRYYYGDSASQATVSFPLRPGPSPAPGVAPQPAVGPAPQVGLPAPPLGPAAYVAPIGPVAQVGPGAYRGPAAHVGPVGHVGPAPYVGPLGPGVPPAPLGPPVHERGADLPPEVQERLDSMAEQIAGLERQMASQARALRGLLELLLERGVVRREDYLAKVSRKTR